MNFYAVNLYSLDCTKSAELYSFLFGWEISVLTSNHSELITKEGVKVIFSKPSESCPVTPGTLTMTLTRFPAKEELQKFPFTLETYSEEKSYLSLLDEYKNRIWFYCLTSK